MIGGSTAVRHAKPEKSEISTSNYTPGTGMHTAERRCIFIHHRLTLPSRWCDVVGWMVEWSVGMGNGSIGHALPHCSNTIIGLWRSGFGAGRGSNSCNLLVKSQLIRRDGISQYEEPTHSYEMFCKTRRENASTIEQNCELWNILDETERTALQINGNW